MKIGQKVLLIYQMEPDHSWGVIIYLPIGSVGVIKSEGTE